LTGSPGRSPAPGGTTIWHPFKALSRRRCQASSAPPNILTALQPACWRVCGFVRRKRRARALSFHRARRPEDAQDCSLSRLGGVLVSTSQSCCLSCYPLAVAPGQAVQTLVSFLPCLPPVSEGIPCRKYSPCRILPISLSFSARRSQRMRKEHAPARKLSQISSSFFLARTLRRQEFTSSDSLRSLRLCERPSPSSPWLRTAHFRGTVSSRQSCAIPVASPANSKADACGGTMTKRN
jgi:hypothetical protein